MKAGNAILEMPVGYNVKQTGVTLVPVNKSPPINDDH